MHSDLPVALPLPVPVPLAPAPQAVVRIRKARPVLLLLAPGLHPLLLKLPLLPNMLRSEPWPWPAWLSLLSLRCRPKKKNFSLSIYYYGLIQTRTYGLLFIDEQVDLHSNY